MPDPTDKPAPQRRPADARKERLAAELRTNLRKRKSQASARARAETPPDPRAPADDTTNSTE